MLAIGDSPVGEERGKALAAVLDDIVVAVNIQIRLLLTSKRGIRQVFSSGRGAHRHIHVRAVLSLHLLVRFNDRVAQQGRERRIADNITAFGTAFGQVSHVLGVQIRKHLADFRLDACFFQQIAVGVGGDGKPMRDSHTFAGKMLIHLAQRGVLAADQRHITNADFIKPKDQFFVMCLSHILSLPEPAICK